MSACTPLRTVQSLTATAVSTTFAVLRLAIVQHKGKRCSSLQGFSGVDTSRLARGIVGYSAHCVSAGHSPRLVDLGGLSRMAIRVGEANKENTVCNCGCTG